MAVAVKAKRDGRQVAVAAPVVQVRKSGAKPVQSSPKPRVVTAARVVRPVSAPPQPHDVGLSMLGTRIAMASLLFDGGWYHREYPDVAAAKLDPVRHYFDNGSREGRNPNRYFDTNWYASNNPDVSAAGLNPFLHYLLYGAREGRLPSP